MKLTVEISLYPFAENYIPAIDAMIERFQSYADLRVQVTPTCTQLVGEYDRLTAIVIAEIRRSYETHGKAVFVTKFIPDYEPF